MLRSVNELTAYIMQASDGEIGRCQDFLFDDRNRTVRYMVAKTAKWLPGRKVVVSPDFLEQPDQIYENIPIKLTRKQIEDCPPLEEHRTVSRQYEIAYHEYYTLPLYLAGPVPMVAPPREEAVEESAEVSENHLQSAIEINGYTVEALDGDAGQVEDLLVDDQDWTLKFLIVDTGGILTRNKVLVSFDWLIEIGWADRKIRLNLPQEKIESSLSYDPDSAIGLDHYIETHRAYDRSDLWKQLK